MPPRRIHDGLMDFDSDSDVSIFDDDERVRGKGKGKGKGIDRGKRDKGKGKSKEVCFYFPNATCTLKVFHLLISNRMLGKLHIRVHGIRSKKMRREVSRQPCKT